MKTDRITLRGNTDYNLKYPPAEAKKGYVARILGRVSGPLKYERAFFGSEVTILEGDEGLYERQNVDKKGRPERSYFVILAHPEYGLIISVDCENELPKIAKRLDEGASIEDAVEVTNLRPSQRIEGRMIFDAVARTAKQAEKAREGQTFNSAVAACWEMLSVLPEREAKKVISELRKRITSKATT